MTLLASFQRRRETKILLSLKTLFSLFRLSVLEQLRLKVEGNIINAISDPETFTIQSLVRN